MVIAHHYLHRRPAISHAFGLEHEGRMMGVLTFGIPASRSLQISACRSSPDLVIELNRLWCADELPRNTETWFIARGLALMPPLLVVSYADTAKGHQGTVYRAANFHYAGWTDMDRKTPKFDNKTPTPVAVVDLLGIHQRQPKHGRDASRIEGGRQAPRIPRSTKVKYWIATGDARDRKRLTRLCDWPRLSWKDLPPPTD